MMSLTATKSPTSSSSSSSSPRFLIIFVLGLVLGTSLTSIWNSLITTTSIIASTTYQQEDYISSLPTIRAQVQKTGKDDSKDKEEENEVTDDAAKKQQDEKAEAEIQRREQEIQRKEEDLQQKQEEMQRIQKEQSKIKEEFEKEKQQLKQKATQMAAVAVSTTPAVTTTTSTITNLTLGQQIINVAYEWAYKDMLEYCPDRGHEYFTSTKTSFPTKFEHFRQCLETTYGKLIKDPLRQSKYPWWLLTLIRDSADRKTGLLGGWHQLYLSPEIEMCVYEKGGTKNWKTSMFKLKKIREEKEKKELEKREREIELMRHDYKRRNVTMPQDQLGVWKPDVPKPTKHPDQFIFIRDPLDRFLSGFLDKCVTPHYYVEPHCEPLKIFGEEHLAYKKIEEESKLSGKVINNRHKVAMSTNITTIVNDFRKVVPSSIKKKLFEAYVDSFPLKWNVHFIPLSFQCGGLYNTLKYYNFKGHMGNDFYNEIDKLTTMYPSIRDVVDDFFHFKDQVAKQQQKQSQQNSSTTTTNNANNAKDKNNVGVETKAATKVLDYYTPSTVRKVLEYFSMDYKMLDIPIPQWAEDMLVEEQKQHNEILK